MLGDESHHILDIILGASYRFGPPTSNQAGAGTQNCVPRASCVQSRVVCSCLRVVRSDCLEVLVLVRFKRLRLSREANSRGPVLVVVLLVSRQF